MVAARKRLDARRCPCTLRVCTSGSGWATPSRVFKSCRHNGRDVLCHSEPAFQLTSPEKEAQPQWSPPVMRSSSTPSHKFDNLSRCGGELLEPTHPPSPAPNSSFFCFFKKPIAVKCVLMHICVIFCHTCICGSLLSSR